MTSHASSRNDSARLLAARDQAVAALLAERVGDEHWCGELSSSALSTATAVCALSVWSRNSGKATREHARLIQRGLRWLAEHANEDGGWGDTVRSFSNICTTTLVWAAFGAAPEVAIPFAAVMDRAEQWLGKRAGSLAPERLATAIANRYGKDRTFSVPILTMCALAGRLGAPEQAWRIVPQLPFELAALPHQFYGALRLPVVSYALPALIAIGQVRHHFRPTRNPMTRALRHLTRKRTMQILSAIQPENGGFLEATPLTSFVTMSLAGMGLGEHLVTRRGIAFLEQSARADGSWPIDTNLATWVTTLSINALGPDGSCPAEIYQKALAWLLQQQYRVEHPYTHAAPGGWAWTNLPGGVPDADDTAGAVLALRTLSPARQAAERVALADWREASGAKPDAPVDAAALLSAAEAGMVWLLNLQNRDGGIPTFCRGWGALLFDRSSPDITAHVMRAWLAWEDSVSRDLGLRIATATARAIRYLAKTQRADGAWLPLWFGHQQSSDDENPLYGTARVLAALAVVHHRGGFSVTALIQRATNWLVSWQNADGGWSGARGAASSVEETGLAVEALAELSPEQITPDAAAAVDRGVAWLIERMSAGQWLEPSPIGFYFARLWYYEKLYPMIFTVGALNRAAAHLAARHGGS